MSTRRAPRPAAPAPAPGAAGPGAPSGGISIMGHRVSNDALVIALASIAGIVVLYRAAKPTSTDAPMVLGGSDPISSVPAASGIFPSQGGPSAPGDSTVIMPPGVGSIPVTPGGPGLAGPPQSGRGSPSVAAISPGFPRRTDFGGGGPIIRPGAFGGAVNLGVLGLSHPQLPAAPLPPESIPQHTPVFQISAQTTNLRAGADVTNHGALTGVTPADLRAVQRIPRPVNFPISAQTTNLRAGYDVTNHGALTGVDRAPSTVGAVTTQGSFAPRVAPQSHAPANHFAPSFIPSASPGFQSYLAGERASAPASMPTPPRNPTPHTNSAPAPAIKARPGGPKPKPKPKPAPVYPWHPRPAPFHGDVNTNPNGHHGGLQG